MSQISPQVEVLHSCPYLSISYYYEAHFLHMDWKGYINVEQVKEGCELIYEVALQKQCRMALNDNRKVKGSWTQAIRWLEQEFMPRIIQVGIQKVAFLYSPQQSARYSVDRLLEINDQYEGQTFEDFNEASHWLLGKVLPENITKPSLLLKTQDRHSHIFLEDVYYITRHEGQTLIQTRDQPLLTRKSLSALLELLPQTQFFRIHKSHIVNTAKIKSLKYHEGGYYHLFLQDFGNIYLPVSPAYVQQLKVLLK